MANITLLGASYTDVPAIDLPKTGGGTVRFFENGGTPSQTQHTILFEFTDETSTSITAYWDSSFVSDAIRATKPTTYGSKTVQEAFLDGVAWYEAANIPIGVELVDPDAVRGGYTVDNAGNIVSSDPWNCVTDYLPIDSSMTFAFSSLQYSMIGFYDSNKNALRTVVANDIADRTADYVAYGTLNSSVIPVGASYAVLVGNIYGLEALSLIRTA